MEAKLNRRWIFEETGHLSKWASPVYDENTRWKCYHFREADRLFITNCTAFLCSVHISPHLVWEVFGM